jgi:hypothetical protein
VVLGLPCLCPWHLIAMALIWLGLAVTGWPKLLAQWLRRPHYSRPLAQRLGVAFALAGAVLTIAPLPKQERMACRVTRVRQRGFTSRSSRIAMPLNSESRIAPSGR